jgi:thiol-disulfide isomerase/thioredoxin
MVALRLKKEFRVLPETSINQDRNQTDTAAEWRNLSIGQRTGYCLTAVAALGGLVLLKSAESTPPTFASASLSMPPHKQLSLDSILETVPAFLNTDQRPSAAALQGMPTVVYFWRTDCLPCLKKLPTINSLSESGKVRIIAVTNEDITTISDWLWSENKETGVVTSRISTVVGAGAALDGLGIKLFPQVIIFDAQGNVTVPLRPAPGSPAEFSELVTPISQPLFVKPGARSDHVRWQQRYRGGDKSEITAANLQDFVEKRLGEAIKLHDLTAGEIESVRQLYRSSLPQGEQPGNNTIRSQITDSIGRLLIAANSTSPELCRQAIDLGLEISAPGTQAEIVEPNLHFRDWSLSGIGCIGATSTEIGIQVKEKLQARRADSKIDAYSAILLDRELARLNHEIPDSLPSVYSELAPELGQAQLNVSLKEVFKTPRTSAELAALESSAFGAPLFTDTNQLNRSALAKRFLGLNAISNVTERGALPCPKDIGPNLQDFLADAFLADTAKADSIQVELDPLLTYQYLTQLNLLGVEYLSAEKRLPLTRHLHTTIGRETSARGASEIFWRAKILLCKLAAFQESK